jgi:hypothetical protein
MSTSQSFQTFKDLFIFLQSFDGDFLHWIQDSWNGPEKQESALRLFAKLGLVRKLSSYKICKGNFNECTVEPINTFKEIFYHSDNSLINMKDKGDKSDLHGMLVLEDENKKIIKKTILATDSKKRENYSTKGIGGFDIREIIKIYYEQYKSKGWDFQLCVCVRDTNELEDLKNRVNKCNYDLKQDVSNAIIIDWTDLNEAFLSFSQIYKNELFDNLLKNEKKNPINLKFHQYINVKKIYCLFLQGVLSVLLGAIPRSGKNYIMAGCIIENEKKKKSYQSNYIVITTRPRETLDQYSQTFECYQLRDFSIQKIDGGNRKPTLTNKNIILCSKQFLQNKLDNDEYTWLEDIDFDMCFVDEVHEGGSTVLSQDILNKYLSNTFTVYTTATYNKPVTTYDIPKEHWILWDLEDVKICRSLNQDGVDADKKIQKLYEKHNSPNLTLDEFKKLINQYSIRNIVEEYSKYPDLVILTDRLNQEVTRDVIKNTVDNQYGWSPEACFLLKQNNNEDKYEFQNEEEHMKMWYKIFGKYEYKNIPSKDYPDDKVFMKRIEKICKNSEKKSRFFDYGNPMVIMAFLPHGGNYNLEELSKATKSILQRKHPLFHPESGDYIIRDINSKITKDSVNDIKDAKREAKNKNKKGVLILSGKQCSTGVTITDCDIVLLMNNLNSSDLIIQMMFRSMTEEENKKYGFVVDLNIHRVVDTLVQYSSIVKPKLQTKDAVEYLLYEKIISFNIDDWDTCFGSDKSQLKIISEYVSDIFYSNTDVVLTKMIDRIYSEISVDTPDFKQFCDLLTYLKIKSVNKSSHKKDENDENEDDESIKKGIEKIEKKKEEKEEEKSNIITNFLDFFKYCVPLVCILTIHNKEKSFHKLCCHIDSNESLFSVFKDQIEKSWKIDLNHEVFLNFINIYKKYIMNKDIERITSSVKEMFLKNKYNPKELSKLIDKYLIPLETEKKDNAEISTPFKLRRDMLDKIPQEFWKSVKKVFEPCCGKGGFIVDIIDRFMNGLKEAIPDEKLRYKTIVEECLYFSDINSTNIFICKLLIDHNNEYKLNYNQGNTLELDIKEKWSIDGFDAVIGNPPYQVKVGPKKTKPIWNLFTKKYLDNLIENGYLLFVHPSGWRSPDGVFRDVYDKILSKNLIYLNMNDFKKGREVFGGVGTNFDYYLLQNNNNKQPVEIVDIYDKNYTIDLSKWSFIPGGGFELYEKVLSLNGEEKVEVLHDYSSYETRKKWISKNKSEEYKYPCCYTITIRDGMKCFYSSEKKGHFDIPKVIWSNGLGTYPVIDENGEYGLTQFSYAIVDDKETLNNIKLALENTKFIKLMEYVKFTDNKYNHKVIALFKKNFWKEFI